MDGTPGTTVALVADTSPVVTATRAVARTILWSAAVSSWSWCWWASSWRGGSRRRSIACWPSSGRRRPTLPSRADVGHDEVGALAAAFNGMLDRLEQSREALVRSEKLGLAGLFAARVAHDIRNPLSSIRMQTQLLQAKAGSGTDERDDPVGRAAETSIRWSRWCAI